MTTPVSAASSSATTGTAGAGSTDTGTALSSLSSNENTFLNLLLTQLKNQDPSSPTDTNQFTTELVQYSQVEQQINTNSSLTQLIALTQSQGLLQATSLVGHQVDLQSTQLPLQSGSAALQFTAPAAEPVTISLANAAGTVVKTATVQATAGAQTWQWDGTDNLGRALPDGPYTASVLGTASDGSTAAVPFTPLGTATSVMKQGNGLQVQFGPNSSFDLANVLSIAQ